MVPTDGSPGTPRRPRPKRAADPIREAAADGRAEWGDPDPWGDPNASEADRGLNRTLGEWLEAVVPPEAQLHFYNAGREFAAGVQTTMEYHMRGRTDGEGEDGDSPVRIEIE